MEEPCNITVEREKNKAIISVGIAVGGGGIAGFIFLGAAAAAAAAFLFRRRRRRKKCGNIRNDCKYGQPACAEIGCMFIEDEELNDENLTRNWASIDGVQENNYTMASEDSFFEFGKPWGDRNTAVVSKCGFDPRETFLYCIKFHKFQIDELSGNWYAMGGANSYHGHYDLAKDDNDLFDQCDGEFPSLCDLWPKDHQHEDVDLFSQQFHWICEVQDEKNNLEFNGKGEDTLPNDDEAVMHSVSLEVWDSNIPLDAYGPKDEEFPMPWNPTLFVDDQNNDKDYQGTSPGIKTALMAKDEEIEAAFKGEKQDKVETRAPKIKVSDSVCLETYKYCGDHNSSKKLQQMVELEAHPNVDQVNSSVPDDIASEGSENREANVQLLFADESVEKQESLVDYERKISEEFNDNHTSGLRYDGNLTTGEQKLMRLEVGTEYSVPESSNADPIWPAQSTIQQTKERLELLQRANDGEKGKVKLSLFWRYVFQVAGLNHQNAKRRLVILIVMVLSGSLRVWYFSRPLLQILLMHLRNYLKIKLLLMLSRHLRNYRTFKIIPKILGS